MSNLIMMSGKQRLFQVGTCLTAGGNFCRSVTVIGNNKGPRCFSSSTLFHSFASNCNSKLLTASTNSVQKVCKRNFDTSLSPLCSTGTALVGRRKERYDPASEYRKMQDEISGVDDAMQEIKDNQAPVITIPIHLEKRLERRREKENTKRAIRERIRNASREGNKNNVVIHSKFPDLNHYKGQSYDKTKEVPLASKGWNHRKSAGDFFTVFPGFQRDSPFFMEDTKSMTFADLGVSELLCENLKNIGIETPTHIQVFGIPELFKENKYNIIAAETGCGKTLVYLLPVIQQILQNRRFRIRQKPGHPSVVILTPSRELSDQIYKVALKLTTNLDIIVKIVQGGNLGNKLKNPTSHPIDILVATTNAIKVLSSAGVYGMSGVKSIILDEVDTLLDDSFFPELVGPFLARFPWDDLQRDLRLTMVGATLPKNIETSVGQFLNTDDFVTISTPGLHSFLPHVPQTFLRLNKTAKASKILEIVKKDHENNIPVIIFCNRSGTCDWLSKHINDHGIDCVSVHGRMLPKYRRGRVDAFKDGEINVMVSTDLSSRGIDTVRAQHIINYEFPLYLADYVHRCGRTGRLGSAKRCRVTNFITRRGEVRAVNDIERNVRKDVVPEVDANIKRLYQKHYGQFVEIQPIKDDNDD